MKKVETLLNQPPLTRPSDTMDRKAEELFEQARSNSRQNWFTFQVPAWGALAACISCLFIGRLWLPESETQQASTPTPIVVPETPSTPAITTESEPEVFVQITQNSFSGQTSLFLRENGSKSRFSSSWTLTH